jgi:triacylglycerol lipase
LPNSPEEVTLNLVFASGYLIPQRIFTVDYFRDLPERYHDALFTNVPVTGTVKERAENLAEQIAQKFPAGPIHIIAHSMGGLDARYLLGNNIHQLADPGRVVCLSTISMPHRGSPIADLLVGPEPSRDDPRWVAYHMIMDAFHTAGIDTGALGDLTTGFARDFNIHYPPFPHIRYISYAGKGCYALLLKATYFYIAHTGHTPEEQTNDGLVSLDSAIWGEWPEDPWDADHISEVGHLLVPPFLPGPNFDFPAAITRLVNRALQ